MGVLTPETKYASKLWGYSGGHFEWVDESGLLSVLDSQGSDLCAVFDSSNWYVTPYRVALNTLGIGREPFIWACVLQSLINELEALEELVRAPLRSVVIEGLLDGTSRFDLLILDQVGALLLDFKASGAACSEDAFEKRDKDKVQYARYRAFMERREGTREIRIIHGDPYQTRRCTCRPTQIGGFPSPRGAMSIYGQWAE